MHRKARPNGKFIALRDAEIEYGIPYHHRRSRPSAFPSGDEIEAAPHRG